MGIMKSKLTRAKYLTSFALRPFKHFVSKESFRKNMTYATYLKTVKVKKNMILFETSHGSKMGGNPYAIFKAMVKHPDYKHFQYVVVLNEEDYYARKYKHLKNVTFVVRDSKPYLKYLAQAKYLINDTTFPFYFQKREEQIYVNTWHGTPLKTLGKDVKGTIGQHKNAIRNFLHADYIINPNRFTADIMASAHDLNGIYNGLIVDEGYPRNDLTINADVVEMKKEFSQLLDIDLNKKIVLYAPTWRGEIGKVDSGEDEMVTYIKELNEKMPNEYLFLLKVHNLTYNSMSEELKKYCVPNWIETNELLSIVDILITDYSSIFFDFMPTKKPILFFMYDKERYEKDRGFYIDLNDLPGPHCRTVDTLVEAIKTIDTVTQQYSTKYEQALKTYCYHDDGKATERFLAMVFQNKRTEHMYQINNDKTKILLYGGGFTTNGVTSSALSLLRNLDYEKYDVTVMYGGKINPQIQSNLEKLPPEAKVLYRMGACNFTLGEYYMHQLIMNSGLKRPFVRKHIPKKLYKKELQRLVGDTQFDIAIDFSGYSPFWTLMFAFNDFKRKGIYLHSDMVADSQREIDGKQKFKTNFNIIFNLYNQFNKLICVSKEVTETNKEKLKKYGVAEKIVNVDNSIDYRRVLHHVDEVETGSIFGKDYFYIDKKLEYGSLLIRGVEEPKQENVNFITVGRFSPEKDHEKLIHAFSKVHQTHPNTRLYLVGYGPLEAQIKSLIRGLDLDHAIFIAGEMDNPFGLMNKCDCFVMSSNYEGQGLAVLEALILKMPTISTDIPGPRGILEEGYGCLVENNADALAQGMVEYIEKRPTYKPFDYETYNQRAMETFYKEICE